MKTYTVKQLSELLKTNEETIRRWIRSGKLTATQSSKKGGNVISSDALNQFIKNTPKYASVITGSLATSQIALSVVVGSVIGGLLAAMEGKKNMVSEADIEQLIKKLIEENEKKIQIKKVEIKKMELEIEEMQQNLEKYNYMLENIDLKLLVNEINKNKE